jgi:hypothetical protein
MSRECPNSFVEGCLHESVILASDSALLDREVTGKEPVPGLFIRTSCASEIYLFVLMDFFSVETRAPAIFHPFTQTLVYCARRTKYKVRLACWIPKDPNIFLRHLVSD